MKSYNKNAIVTTLNDKYILPFSYMIESLITNSYKNKSFDIIIINIGLSQKNIDKILLEYPFIQILNINFSNYDLVINNTTISLKKISKINNTRIYENYYKLEIFNIKNYEKLLFIDSDCVVVNDISNVFSDFNEFPIYAVKDDMPKYSVGVMLLNTLLIDCQYWYSELLKNIFYRGGDFGGSKNGESDQAVLNELLYDKFGKLPKCFNSRPNKHDQNIPMSFDNVQIIHFAGIYKPWIENCSSIDTVNKQYVDRIWKTIMLKYIKRL